MGGVNPWAELRADEAVELVWACLPDGVRGLYVDGDPPTVVLDAGLGRVQRNATLLHELEHHRRGICGIPRYDERGVDDAVARQLVPCEELAAMHEIAVLNDLPVEPWMVAEKFDVPDDVAERAMRLSSVTRTVQHSSSSPLDT